MAQIDPSELGPDELYLSGKLQVETALEVLNASGINPVGQTVLTGLLAIHDTATSASSQEDLTVYLQGEQAEALKSDIGMAAVMAEQNQGLSEDQRIAAQGLLSVLGLEK